MHRHEKLVREQIQAFIDQDVPAWRALVTDDLTVHVPSGHPLSGDYRGADEFMARFFGPVMERTGGVEVADVHDVLASDDHAVGLYRMRSQRDGKPYEWLHTNIYHFSDGLISEIWWNPFDEQTVAELLA